MELKGANVFEIFSTYSVVIIYCLHMWLKVKICQQSFSKLEHIPWGFQDFYMKFRAFLVPLLQGKGKIKIANAHLKRYVYIRDLDCS